MNQLKTLWHLYNYSGDYKPRIIKATSYSVLNKVFDLFPPLLLGMAVDTVVKKDDSYLASFGDVSQFEQLLIIALLTFVIWVLESLFEYLFTVEWRRLAQSIQHKLRMDCYAHLLRLDHSFYEEQSSGNLVSIVNDDVNQLERFLDVGMNEILQVMTTVIVIGAIYFAKSPMLAILSFITMPIIIYGSIWYQGFLAPRYKKVREHVGLLGSELNNNLQGMGTIKSFARESGSYEKLKEISHSYLQANEGAIKVSALFTPLIRMLVMTGFIITLLYGGRLTIDGELSVGTYSVMIFLIQRLLWPLTRLGQTLDLFQRAMASANRAFDLLKVNSKVKSGKVLAKKSEVKGSIKFDHVGFVYSNGTPVLKDISLDVAPKESIGLVGSTGSGKSSMIKLLQRFYDPTSGEITLDGKPLKDYSLHSLRSAISVVSQDVYLFHGSVMENIRFAKPDATDEEIFEACKKAHIHDFIVELPDGYMTVVGERGQKLSGGQKQRLSIARAIIADCPIVILDEATSAVDNVTEARLQRSLDKFLIDRTTIVIAHRLSTVLSCSRILVLEGGRILEEGSHKDLISMKGIYQDLWNVQTGLN